MLKKIAGYGFLSLFLCSMLWVSVAAWQGVSQSAINVLLVALVLCAFFALVYRLILQKADALTPRKMHWLVGGLLLAFTAFATLFGCLTMTYPVSDLEILCNAVAYWIEHGHLLQYSYYFTVCSNTLGNCIFLYAIFKPLSYFGLTIGTDAAEGIAIFINVLMLTLSIFLLYRIATRILPRHGQQLLFLVLSLSFAPYYLWAHRYYSDTLAMPFVPLAIWLYLRASESTQTRKQIAYSAAIGVCLWVGFFIKGSALIALPALLIFAVFTQRPRALLRLCLPMLLSLCLCMGGWELYRHNNSWINYENEAYDNYPSTMWLLYGAHGDGNYADEDVTYLASFETYQERADAAKERLIGYYSEYSPASYLTFLNTKFAATWSNGEYDAQLYLSASRNSNWTHYFIMENQPLYALTNYYCNGWHYAFLAMLLLSTAAALRKAEWDAGFLLRICLFGLVLFLCFWETKPRYLFSFAVVFPLFFAQGILCIDTAIQRLRGKKENQ